MFGFGEVAGLAVGTHVETKNGRIGCRCQGDVVFGDSTYCTVNESQLDFITLKATQAFGHCFKRTLYVGLQDEVQCCHFTSLNLREHIFELDATLYASIATLCLGTQTLFTSFTNGTSGLFVWCNAEFVASLRNS